MDQDAKRSPGNRSRCEWWHPAAEAIVCAVEGDSLDRNGGRENAEEEGMGDPAMDQQESSWVDNADPGDEDVEVWGNAADDEGCNL